MLGREVLEEPGKKLNNRLEELLLRKCQLLVLTMFRYQIVTDVIRYALTLSSNTTLEISSKLCFSFACASGPSSNAVESSS